MPFHNRSGYVPLNKYARGREYSKDDSFIQNSKVSHSEMGILGSGKDKVSLPISFVKPSAGTGWFIFLIKRLALCFLF